MEQDNTAEKFRNMYEPLFSRPLFSLPSMHFLPKFKSDEYNFRESLCNKISKCTQGEDRGGYILDYMCGCISLKKYMMKCQLKNINDFHLGIIYEIVSYWKDWFLNNKLLHMVAPDVLEFVQKRLKNLGFEISKLNSKMNDIL